jgi:hypothetical protein
MNNEHLRSQTTNDPRLNAQFFIQNESNTQKVTDSLLSQQRATELEQKYKEKYATPYLSLPKEAQPPAPFPFPFAALGPILGPAAKRIHEIVKAPDSICGHSMLAAAALMTQPYADIHIDGRIYPLSLFMLTVAESGDRKSAVDNIVLKPIRDFEKMLAKCCSQEKGNYKNKLDSWRSHRVQILKESNQSIVEKALNALGLEPLAPLAPHILLEEPTYEGLVKLLALGQPSLGLFSDEGGRMFGGFSMSKESLLKTICGLSSLWDGKPVNRIRAGDENLLLYGRRFSMHLMIQEIILSDIQKNQLLTNQGMVARCLIVQPISNAGFRPYCEIDIAQDALIISFWQHAANLLDTPFPLVEGTQNELMPRQLMLDPEAKKIWISFHNVLDAELHPDGLWHPIRRTANKAAEQALRIAGVLTLTENIEAKSISLEILERAICLTQYYLNEALRISEMSFIDPDMALAQKVYKWMVNRYLENKQSIFSLQEIYQLAGPRGARKKENALRSMRIMEEQGWIYSLDNGSKWELIFAPEVR